MPALNVFDFFRFRNEKRTQEVARCMHILHVTRDEALKSILATEPYTLLTTDAAISGTNTCVAEDILKLRRSVYFYAGRAYGEFGGITFAYGPDCELAHTGEAFPFDTGGLALGYIDSSIGETRRFSITATPQIIKEKWKDLLAEQGLALSNHAYLIDPPLDDRFVVIDISPAGMASYSIRKENGDYGVYERSIDDLRKFARASSFPLKKNTWRSRMKGWLPPIFVTWRDALGVFLAKYFQAPRDYWMNHRAYKVFDPEELLVRNQAWRAAVFEVHFWESHPIYEKIGAWAAREDLAEFVLDQVVKLRRVTGVNLDLWEPFLDAELPVSGVEDHVDRIQQWVMEECL